MSDDVSHDVSDDNDDAEVVVLGLGNVLCGDDGAGVRAVELLAEHYAVPAGVRLLDGGTLGLGLLGWACAAKTLLLVDAVRCDETPGTLVEISGDEVAPAVRDRLSVHQVGVTDLLDALRLLGRYPPSLRLLGVVPKTLDLGVGLSPEVERSIPALAASVLRHLEALGHRMEERIWSQDHETRSSGSSATSADRELAVDRAAHVGAGVLL
jgi:hydrogenase maturation protease